MFENNYGIIYESYNYQITITILLVFSFWLTFYLSANNIFWSYLSLTYNMSASSQPKCFEMSRLTEVVAVNADLAYMFLDKYFLALHVFVNPLSQPANQPQ